MTTVCVFCGHQPGGDAAFVTAARDVGRLLARAQVRVVYGGGRIGLMGELASAALAEGGEVIGVIPELLFERGHAHERVKLIRTPDMHTRKRTMYDLADAFVALPGGIGTMDELFETMSWNQLGVHRKPCAALNVLGYYDAIVQWMANALANGFIQGGDVEGLIVESDVATLVARLAMAGEHMT